MEVTNTRDNFMSNPNWKSGRNCNNCVNLVVGRNSCTSRVDSPTKVSGNIKIMQEQMFWCQQTDAWS